MIPTCCSDTLLTTSLYRPKQPCHLLIVSLRRCPGFIGREVALEVVWVLERSYDFSRSRIVNAMLNLMEKDGLIVENAQDVAYAFHQYSQSND